VRIVISTAPRFDWAAHPNLDPARPDDQLVAEALAFGHSAGVFSHDAGPRIRARIAKIEAYEPAAEWLLPVEQTDDQRKITKLERDLKQALSPSPNIVAGFDNFDEATSEIRVIRPIVQPLDPQLVHRLVSQYLAKHPSAEVYSTDHGLFGIPQIGDISEHQVDRYYADYSSFEAKLHDYYANLHERVRSVGAAAAIDYWVRNDSGVAAKGLRIEFDLQGSGSLLADREDAVPYVRSLQMPEAPEKPRSALDYINIPRQGQMEPRDPVAFYWFKRPQIVAKHSARQCEEFRPTRKYRDSILVLTPDDLSAKLGLHLHIEAANLPAPVNISAKINIVEQALEWSDPIVQAILSDGVCELD
jgi:hypothetical protein